MGELASAVSTTATGLEGFSFDKPAYAGDKRDSPVDHCSAFAATGPATRDGKMVIGHVTWWPLTLAEQTNVMLDIKPAAGHRMLIQSYPGGIESGTDWYQNDAGVVLTETTIRQTPFNAQGTPVAFRARMAIQYGGNIDEVVKQSGHAQQRPLHQRMADRRRQEQRDRHVRAGHQQDQTVAQFEERMVRRHARLLLGRQQRQGPRCSPGKLPRSEGRAGLHSLTFPAIRDLAWQNLYQSHKGQIDEQFAFLAFRTAPLVSASTMDAKVATSDMANRMMVWAEFGKPNQREWTP